MRFWTGWRRFSSTEPSTLQTQMWARQRGWKTPLIKVFEWLIWGANKNSSKDRCRVVTFEWLIIGVSEKPSSGCLEAGNCNLLSVSGLSCRSFSYQNLVLLLYSWTLYAYRWIGPPPCVLPCIVKICWFRITIIQFFLKIFVILLFQENGQLKLNVQYVSMSAISQVNNHLMLFS